MTHPRDCKHKWRPCNSAPMHPFDPYDWEWAICEICGMNAEDCETDSYYCEPEQAELVELYAPRA